MGALSKSEFADMLANPFKYHSANKTQDNSMLAYLDSLDKLNDYLRKENMSLAGFCKAPWSKELVKNFVLEIAVIIEDDSTFEKYWFHMSNTGLTTLIEAVLDVDIDTAYDMAIDFAHRIGIKNVSPF